MPHSNTDKALQFIALWNGLDVNAIADTYSADIFYHNIPMQPIHGRNDFRVFIGQFIKDVSSTSWEVLNIAETESGAVLTERIDHFEFKSGRQLALRVMGYMEFNGDGKVAVWRDYFDMAELQGK